MGNKDTNKLCPRSLVTVTNHFCDKNKHENSCHIFQNTYSHHQVTHAECHAKRNTRNMEIEVETQPRRQLLQNKLKLEWTICKIDDYVSISKCFKCSLYNHRHTECRSEEICPLVLENRNWTNIRRRGPTISVSTAWHSTPTAKTWKSTRTIHHSIGTAPAYRRWSLNTGRIQTINMAQTVNTRKRIIQVHKNTSPLATIRCMQINVQHSRTETDNLRNLIEQDSSHVIFMQEPYLYKNRMTGLRNLSPNYISPNGTSREVILITTIK